MNPCSAWHSSAACQQDRVQDGGQVERRPAQRLQNVADGRLVGEQALDVAIIGPCHAMLGRRSHR